MKYFNLEKAKDRCFGVIASTGYEEEFADEIESAQNAKDLVQICEEMLKTYLDDDYSNSMDRTDRDPEVRKRWRSDVGKLKRFINTYNRFI